MRNVIAAFNTTLDAISDHTAGIADAELHQHYADLLRQAGCILYGRTTFELMKYWQTVVEHPTGNPAMDDFARAIDQLPKLVFSNTLQDLGWETATLAQQDLATEVAALKQQSGGDVLVGSRSLIVQLLRLNLVDEFQLCLHPVVAGAGQALFHDLDVRRVFRLVRVKPFQGGAVVLSYQPMRE